MNVRKPVDYSMMYRELTAILAQNLPQMDEVYAIGKAISRRLQRYVWDTGSAHGRWTAPDGAVLRDWQGRLCPPGEGRGGRSRRVFAGKFP